MAPPGNPFGPCTAPASQTHLRTAGRLPKASPKQTLPAARSLPNAHRILPSSLGSSSWGHTLSNFGKVTQWAVGHPTSQTPPPTFRPLLWQPDSFPGGSSIRKVSTREKNSRPTSKNVRFQKAHIVDFGEWLKSANLTIAPPPPGRTYVRGNVIHTTTNEICIRLSPLRILLVSVLFSVSFVLGGNGSLFSAISRYTRRVHNSLSTVWRTGG